MSDSTQIKVNISSRSTHRGPEHSTTLNRRYVKRPTKLTITDGSEKNEAKAEVKEQKTKITHMAPVKIEKKPVQIEKVEEKDLPPAPNPYQAAINARKKAAKKRTVASVDSRALKDAAIKKALAEMDNYTEKYEPSKAALREERIAEKVMRSEMAADKKAASDKKLSNKKAAKESKHFKKHKPGRIILALAASAASMIALAAIIKINLPNISVKVAAAQTGVEASYPNYIPRDYSLTGVYTNDQNSVVIEFKGPEDKKFTLSEDKSSWDSSALLTNYVKGAYGTDYDVIREQGITIYISYSNAAWVNNGIFYRITAQNGTLTKKQIKNIVGSI